MLFKNFFLLSITCLFLTSGFQVFAQPFAKWDKCSLTLNNGLVKRSGNYYDPAVVLHEVTGSRGLVLGNEVPGVLKNTTAMLDGKPLELTVE